MNPIAAPMLPSPALFAYYQGDLEARLAGVKAALRDPLLDGLGDLALALARRPIRRWSGSRDALARALGERWAWPEATAVVEVAAQVGLLVKLPDDSLRPRDVGTFTWLGARRIARTEDQDGLMDHRMNGGLFDMFALAPSLLADPEQAAGVVRLMAERDGPFEELLELGSALAAQAVAWGAPATPELRAFLTERALSWTQPMGADWNRDVGTALLVHECRVNEDKEHLQNLASEMLAELVTSALDDAELAHSPAILATLDTQIAMLVGSAGGPSATRERVELVAGRLPRSHAHRPGRALARVLAPGHERNRLLAHAARLAIEAGDPRGALVLEALAEPYEGDGVEILARLLERGEGNLRDRDVMRAAYEACQVVRGLERCPAPLGERLLELVGGDVAPELRIAAASALARHGTSAEAPVVRAIEEAFGRDETLAPEPTAGAVGALLHLGSEDLRLGPVALALGAGELPGPLAQLLRGAVDEGVRRVPAHAQELGQLYHAFAARPELAQSLLAVCAVITDVSQADYELGPFASGRPLPDAAREALLGALVPMAADHEQPERAAEAATACAGLLRGDPVFAAALVHRRAQAEGHKIKSLYDLALGATRVFEPAVVDRLARDAAQADFDVAAAAAVALRLLLETYDQADRLEPWVRDLRARVDQMGPHQVPTLQLLAQVATLPLGG